jgi:hypothetical protein
VLDESQIGEWLKEHEAELEQYKGEWICISLKQGIVGTHAPDLSQAMSEFNEKFKGESAYIHRVETEEEKNEEKFTL